jgi:hypothetical protein
MRYLLVFVLALAPAQAQQRTPVLLELFTAEGCSSCPPADDLISAVDELQPIAGAQLIVLSEHVTYWDGSSKDRFGLQAVNNRQLAYSQLLKVDGVFTPQMVIDGQYQCVGGNGPEVKRLILKALEQPKPLLELTATREGTKIKANVSFFGIDGASVLIAIAEDKAQTKITKGENAGKTLRHTAVVRSLHVVGKSSTGRFDKNVELPLPFDSSLLRIVAFVQDEKTGRILTATQSKL